MKNSIAQKVRDVIAKQPDVILRGAVYAALPGVSKHAIEATLKSMRKSGKLVRIGYGRYRRGGEAAKVKDGRTSTPGADALLTQAIELLRKAAAQQKPTLEGFSTAALLKELIRRQRVNE